ncbi:hypothetical protein ACLK17_01310 [Escherichia coli]
MDRTGDMSEEGIPAALVAKIPRRTWDRVIKPAPSNLLFLLVLVSIKPKQWDYRGLTDLNALSI